MWDWYIIKHTISILFTSCFLQSSWLRLMQCSLQNSRILQLMMTEELGQEHCSGSRHSWSLLLPLHYLFICKSLIFYFYLVCRSADLVNKHQSVVAGYFVPLNPPSIGHNMPRSNKLKRPGRGRMVWGWSRRARCRSAPAPAGGWRGWGPGWRRGRGSCGPAGRNWAQFVSVLYCFRYLHYSRWKAAHCSPGG